MCPPNAAVVLVLAHHHGHGVPTDEAFDAPLHGAVARVRQLAFGTDRVDIRGIEEVGNTGALGARAVGQLLQEISRAVRAGLIDYLVKGLNPFRGLPRIQVHNPLVPFLVH